MPERRNPSERILMGRSVESYQKHRVECCVCGKKESACDVTMTQFVTKM